MSSNILTLAENYYVFQGNRVDPDVPRIEHLDALYRVAHTARWPNRLSATKRTDWWRAFIVLDGWTGFRLSDLRLLADQHVAGSSIELRAEKTKRFGRPRLVVPVTPVVRRHLGMLGRGNPTLFGLTAQGKQLRRTLSELADQAGVPYVTPKGFRLYAINAWSRADGLAGELIQGRKLGSMDNYLDVESHLHHHARKVKIPNSWLTDQERDRLAQRRDNLLHMFDRAKPGKQKLILKLCREIA